MSLQQFDLNIESILEDWEVFHALREVIANALDEQILSQTKDIEIYESDGFWHIRDYGRGLKYEHLTLNENEEKIHHPYLIGKFGVGLKDALATFDRHNVQIKIKSKFGDISIGKIRKHGFEELITLHALIDSPSDPNMTGTEFLIKGISSTDVSNAKKLFLRFQDIKKIDSTNFGDIFDPKNQVPSIYINGVKVAEENNFIFSYNITSLDQKIKKALNRERTNVGRTAYTDRIKAILKSSNSSAVASILAKDLQNISEGEEHDELKWIDVQEHAVKILNIDKHNVFVSTEQIMQNPNLINEAKSEGYSIVPLPTNLVNKIENQSDYGGNPIFNFGTYIDHYNDSFEYNYISINELSDREREVYESKKYIFDVIGKLPYQVKDIKISTTIKPINGEDTTEGVWDHDTGYIVIRREILDSYEKYLGTLIHEIAHVTSHCGDETRIFENQLTIYLGLFAARHKSYMDKTKSQVIYENDCNSQTKNEIGIKSSAKTTSNAKNRLTEEPDMSSNQYTKFPDFLSKAKNDFRYWGDRFLEYFRDNNGTIPFFFETRNLFNKLCMKPKMLFDDKMVSTIYLESSNIEAVGYNLESQQLLVRFKNGGVYRYFGIPNKVFIDFLLADSHGEFLSYSVIGQFKYERLS